MKSTLPILALLATALPLLAIQDSNSNGLSDVWEKFYNGGNLFSGGNPDHDPAADPDADGWTNADEAVAGTDPFSSVLPAGWVRTSITSHPESNGLFLLSWPSTQGKSYQLSMSTDLVAWADCGGLIAGTGSDIELALDCQYEVGGTPERMFWRVRIADNDPDGDTLTSWEELALGLNPNHPDSDLDGIFDGVDPEPLASATLADPDGLGLPTSLDDGLIGRWDYEQILNPGGSQTIQDLAGGDDPLTCSLGSLSTEYQGMISKGVSLDAPGDHLEGPASLVAGRSAFSISTWFQVEPDLIQTRALNTVLFAYNAQLDAYPDFQVHIAKAVTPLDSQKLIFSHYHNGQIQPEWVIPMPHEFRFDDGEWRHLAFVKSGSQVEIFLNGQSLGTRGTSATWTAQTGAYLCFGKLAPVANDPGHGLRGAFDRTRFYNRDLNAAEATALYQQDTDRDGLWDITETRTSLWRDANSDGQPSASEFHFIASPFEWQFPGRDSDGDGADDEVEQAAGTLIGRADTDGDLLPDGWELLHGLDPLVSNATDSNGNGRFEDNEYTNSDPDALTDIEEYRYNTDPNSANSDGGIPGYPDNSDDAMEVGQGSNPNDPTDGGQAPAPEQMQPILLGIGDESGSESEDYVLHCYQLDPESGAETRVFTLRSGGYGEYKEETIGNVFRKGVTYTFQIHWQGSKLTSQPSGPGQSAEGPDFDYTFKVELQGADPGGVVVDQWRPGEGSADPASPLRAVGASDVADTPSEFRDHYENGRVLYLPIRMTSIDRMVGGAIDILPGLAQLELKFSNETTGEQIGTYGYLDGSGNTKVYDETGGMIGPEDGLGAAVADPSVWFLRDAWSPYRTQFYLISGAPGDPQHGTVKVEASFQGVLLGTLRHAMLPVPGFGALIASATDVASGEGFNFGSGATPAPLTNAEKWAAAMLIPVYPIAYGIEGVGILAHGILDGVVNGFKDDWEFAQLILQGIASTADYAAQAVVQNIQNFLNDPMARIQEAKDAIEAFVKDRVFDPTIVNYPGHLDGIPDFLHEYWEKIPLGDTEGFYDKWSSMVDSVLDWFAEVSAEHTAQAEATAWVSTPFDRTRLVANGTEIFRSFCYSTGFAFGYVCEQVAVGAASAGAIPVAKVVVKSGIKTVGTVAVRTAASVAIRLHWWKKILAESALGDAALRAAYERGFVLCAVEPVGPTMKECALEVLEKMLARPSVTRTTYNFKDLVDDIVSRPNLKKLTLTPGKEGELFNRIAQLDTLLGDEIDEAVVRNFVKVADERLVVVHADGTVDEFFEAFFSCFEGNPAVLGWADDTSRELASLSTTGKDFLKSFLSDPNAGYLWKIDDPIWTNGGPGVPHKFFVRGLLAELDVYKRVYKPLGYSHHQTATGFDFKGPSGAPRWVQIKSLSNPDAAIDRMKLAMDDLLNAGSSDAAPLRLHILKKPGSSSDSLELALIQYAADPKFSGRMENPIIQAYDIGSQ